MLYPCALLLYTMYSVSHQQNVRKLSNFLYIIINLDVQYQHFIIILYGAIPYCVPFSVPWTWLCYYWCCDTGLICCCITSVNTQVIILQISSFIWYYFSTKCRWFCNYVYHYHTTANLFSVFVCGRITWIALPSLLFYVCLLAKLFSSLYVPFTHMYIGAEHDVHVQLFNFVAMYYIFFTIYFFRPDVLNAAFG